MLAYYEHSWITEVKSFITLGRGLVFSKLLTIRKDLSRINWIYEWRIFTQLFTIITIYKLHKQKLLKIKLKMQSLNGLAWKGQKEVCWLKYNYYRVGYLSYLLQTGSSNWVHKTQICPPKQGATLAPKLANSAFPLPSSSTIYVMIEYSLNWIQ
jgi:hypothetical protein